MPDLTDTAIRLYRRFFGDHAALFDAEEIPALVLDGNNAIAIAEASIVENAVLSSSFGNSAIDTAWRTELQRVTSNDYGGVVSARSAEGPRGAMAAAIGLALSGRRTTAFLTGQDLAASLDLMTNAAGRHLPLVVHVTNQALAAHGGVKGSGHEALHMALDTGFFTLFATSVQEAVDFTYIARRVAELTLIPGMVVMDGVETAESPQDVQLLSPAQVRRFLGPANELIDSRSVAQKLLFGEQRRRVPQWHNLDRPVLQGALHGPDSFALGALANQPYFASVIGELMVESIAAFAKLTGRKVELLSSHNLKRSDILLVAQGAAAETARVAADHLTASENTRIGVVSIKLLRPFPATELIECFRGKQKVAVLERLDTPLSTDTPLMRELRACFDRAVDRSKSKQAGGSVISSAELPDLHSVIYGIGGLPLRVADLALLPAHIGKTAALRTVLGVDFSSPKNNYPKRQVMLDALRRAYPEVQKQGLKNSSNVTGFLPDESISVAVKRLQGQGYEPLALEIGSILQQIQEGQVRCKPGVSWESWSSFCEDRCICAPQGLADPGDEYPVNLAVLAADSLPSAKIQSRMRLTRDLTKAGIVLLTHDTDPALIREELCEELAGELESGPFKVALLGSLPAGAARSGVEFSELKLEYLLGAVVKTLLENGLVDAKESKVIKAREMILSNLPEQRQMLLLDAFKLGFNAVRLFDLSTAPAMDKDNLPVADTAPVAVEHLRRTDDQYDSLPRFWDQVGVLFRDNDLDELTVDPYMATGSVPPLSSTFRDFSSSRKVLPVFDGTSCTGCGKCWTVCPDSAIGCVAISPANLIDSGIKMAGAVALRQISSQLSARVISQNKKAEQIPGTAGEMLNQAFDWLSDKMSLAEDRKQAVNEAMQELTSAIGNLPVAVTKPFFSDAESSKKDSGELLSLVINPDNCKGCGLCANVCEPGAIAEEVQTPERVAHSHGLWNIWAKTPDTSSETISRVSKDPDIGPLPAALLSRYCSHALSGGDGAESGSGEKIAMRMLLGATEFLQQPIANRFAKLIQTTGDEVKLVIKESLSSVLPLGDIEELEQGLDSISTPRADLATFADKIESDVENHSVDTSTLRRLIRLSRDLTELNWQLTEGLNGLGRARFGMAIAPGSIAGWAGAFPNNSFQAPVVIDMTGDSLQIAAGLLEGQMRTTCETVGLIRKARLEIDRTAGADFLRSGLDRLTWDQLDEEEKQLCPPLFLVGGDDVLAGRGLSQLAWLLNSDLPIKIIVMSDLGFGLTSAKLTKTPMLQSQNPGANLALLAMAQRNAFVAQTSIADARHLHSSITEAIRFSGPALVNIHAPSPERHGFSPDKTLEQSRLAVACRVFPLLAYDPSGEGVFGSRISLQGNPDPEEAWVAGDAPLTPAHWAFTEGRFSAYFSELDANDANAVDLLQWIEMNPGSRRGKYPSILVENGDGAEKLLYRVDGIMAEKVEEQRQNWLMLQELAGLVTPFTARVEQEIKDSLGAEHAAAIDAIKSEYEEKIRTLEQNMVTDMSMRVRDQLVNLMNQQLTQTEKSVPVDDK